MLKTNVDDHIKLIDDSIESLVVEPNSNCIFVKVGYNSIETICRLLSSAIHIGTIPEPPPKYLASVEKARSYLSEIEELHKASQKLINYMVDVVFKLDEHPQVQSYRLAGATVTAGYDVGHRSGRITFSSPQKEEKLTIFFCNLND